MHSSIAKIVSEVVKSAEICEKSFDTISKTLQEKLEVTQEFYKKFSILLNEKPYIFQKCALHGVVLAKEIISKAREEANEECQINLAN